MINTNFIIKPDYVSSLTKVRSCDSPRCCKVGGVLKIKGGRSHWGAGGSMCWWLSAFYPVSSPPLSTRCLITAVRRSEAAASLRP